MLPLLKIIRLQLNMNNNLSNSSSSTQMIKTDYDPVPENAIGPVIPEKGHIVEALDDGLYFHSNGALIQCLW